MSESLNPSWQLGDPAIQLGNFSLQLGYKDWDPTSNTVKLKPGAPPPGARPRRVPTVFQVPRR